MQQYTRRDFLLGAAKKERAVTITQDCLAFLGVSCRACEDYCQQQAIRFRPVLGQCEQPRIIAEHCNQCRDCLQACPVNALSLENITNE